MISDLEEILSETGCRLLECSDAIGLFWDAKYNIFIDEDGFPVWNIFEAITPNDLYLFKFRQEYTLVPHRNLQGVVVELYWPDDDTDWFRMAYLERKDGRWI